ncbi:C40 family peptidase [Paenibacillus pinihumi]|uniref:C40 family peptidase n=1 Tax=Paenibacillus pinihumi TaxID=669462 RepID=UPI0003FA2C50|nr:C40 family peptidase [Paenibacillus pinihumi]
MKKAVLSLLALFVILSFAAGTASANSKMDNAIADLIGTPYRYGGTTTKGFDCSGFTSYVFNQFKLDLPRSSASQAQVGKKVAKDDLRAGDLVFFNTSGKGISHVGIYVGDGKFAHSSSSKGVIISELKESYYVKRYVTARRVMSTDTFEKYADEPSDEVLDNSGDTD